MIVAVFNFASIAVAILLRLPALDNVRNLLVLTDVALGEHLIHDTLQTAWGLRLILASILALIEYVALALLEDRVALTAFTQLPIYHKLR